MKLKGMAALLLSASTGLGMAAGMTAMNAAPAFAQAGPPDIVVPVPQDAATADEMSAEELEAAIEAALAANTAADGTVNEAGLTAALAGLVNPNNVVASLTAIVNAMGSVPSATWSSYSAAAQQSIGRSLGTVLANETVRVSNDGDSATANAIASIIVPATVPSVARAQVTSTYSATTQAAGVTVTAPSGNVTGGPTYVGGGVGGGDDSGGGGSAT